MFNIQFHCSGCDRVAPMFRRWKCTESTCDGEFEFRELDELRAIVDAQSALIDWYETEHDRGSHDDGSLPEDFLELEKAVEVANARAASATTRKE